MISRRDLVKVVMGSSSWAFVNRAWSQGLRPPTVLTVSEWADAHYVLSPANPEPGPWRTSRTPYLREPMDLLSVNSPVRSLTVMKGSQLGFTVGLAGGFLGYTIDHAPAETLIVLPDIKTTRTWVRRKLDPVLRYTPRLKDKIHDPRQRASGNTQFLKEFASGAGALVITWSSSAAGLKSISARNQIYDEIDSFVTDADGEGDPIALAERRSTNFPNAKSLKVSTPSEAGRSAIEGEFLAGDQRYYFLPCPHCGHYQVLRFANFHWAPHPAPAEELRLAWFDCIACDQPIEERWKTQMLAAGDWIPTRHQPGILDTGFESGRLSQLLEDKAVRAETHVSVHLSTFYAPLGWTGSAWLQIARDWTAAQGKIERLKAFTTHTLGETWRERGEAPNWEILQARASRAYELGVVPADALVLYAGIDVQRTWISMDIWGFGRARRRWLVDTCELEGNTAHPDVWRALTERMNRTYAHQAGGELGISGAAIDTGDEQYNSEALYAWIRQMGPALVMAVKGQDHGEGLVGLPRHKEPTASGRANKRGVKIWPVNVSLAKAQLYAALNLPRPAADELPTPGSVSYPLVADEWYRQLVAEEYRTRLHKGRRRGEWIKIRERNEALDKANYAAALAYVRGTHKWTEAKWRALEEFVTVAPAAVQTSALPVPSPVPAAAQADWFGGRGRDWF